MNKFWESLFGLHREQSIWVEWEELGKEKILNFNHKNYIVKIPEQINNKITLRLKGLGRTRGGKTGDLLLHVWLNKGEDITKTLWLSESSARAGAEAGLALEDRKIKVVVPPGSRDGLTLRFKELGRLLPFNWRAPFLRDQNGHLLLKLAVYPDEVMPRYEPFDALSTDDMALEGWVYRKLDEVICKMGRPSFLINPVQADTIANAFNEWGWRGVFNVLVFHLKLNHLNIGHTESSTITLPGSCTKTVTTQYNTPAVTQYLITIHGQFLDNPFSVAAILAHELCHVIYSERIDAARGSTGTVLKTEKASLEEERTVDLLVFMFKIGQFQLRAARDKRLTFGYFNQGIFERIQIIVTRKLNSAEGSATSKAL